MIDYLLSFVLTVFLSYVSIKNGIRIFKKFNIVAIDQHKKNKPLIPTSGGIFVSLSFVFGLLFFIGIRTIITKDIESSLLFFSSITSILIVTIVGILDDILTSKKLVLSKNKEKDLRVGLPQWIKPFLTFPAVLPLVVLNIGEPTVNLPIFGTVDFGLFYPLLIVPLAFVFSTNVVNMLAGFNGMEAGMSIVYLTFLTYVAFQSNSIALPIFLISLASIIPFFIFNFHPAKILPGDSLTYFLGAIIIVGTVVGNMEKAAIFVLLPFLIEFFLKFRSKFSASSLGVLKDGYLVPKYKKIYSLTHLIMRIGKFNERQITIIFILIELFSISLYFIFR